MSDMHDLRIVGRMLAGGVEINGAVTIDDGRITDVTKGVADDAPAAARETVRLANGEVLIPGIVDTHVHINEPGRTEWEGFDCATKAAAAGGVTTVLDMPLNSNPPTLTVDALNMKRACAEHKAHTQLGFWGGVDETNLGTGMLRRLWDEGVFGFKCFLSPSGVDEYGSLAYPKLEAAMREIASFGGQLIIHAEDPHELAAHGGHITDSYRSFVESRPAACEAAAVAQVARLVERTGCRTHLLHISCGASVDEIRTAKAKGLPLTAETCPHYLTLDCDHIPDGNTAFKCCPPIRSLDEQDRLWQGLVDGTLDFVATDHSPADAKMKAGTLATAWGGVSSLQVGFRAVLTGARRRGLGLADAVRWMSANTAAFAGFHDRGAIAPGKRADLAIIRPDDTFTVHADELLSRNPISAFDGAVLNGPISRTIIGGRTVDVNAAGDPSNLIRRP
ncbi:allantoinase AllB [Bifidobacterium amazonense]|uniref:allantoinase n=1 Tax=Bifidobacterium amazonense TaxID=2809027 RepID=A0ABS9VWX3_9BIFI|nr:allantoinase AllB [Bifidobacterium amazonense]MCH9276568.1 allantoinase AllB [Bifidobacterium amazonense]